MRFTKFEILNYKGIAQTAIEIPRSPKPIVALIGLNESGKTTLLEAISHFWSEDEDVSALYPSGNKTENVDNFVPKGKKANFSDTVIFRAHVRLSEVDIASISSEMLAQHKVQLDKRTFPREFTVARSNVFKNSIHKSSSSNWGSLKFRVKSESAKNYTVVSYENQNDLWNAAIKIISPLLPPICFFPSFLFDFPDRIYLTETADEDAAQVAYRKTIADVLRSADRKMNIETHLLERINHFKSENSDDWKQKYDESNVKEIIDAVLEKIETEIGKSVFRVWNTIFSTKSETKSVNLTLRFDPQKEDAPYLVLTIKEGTRRYALGDRSMGFRWFFSFLLFTRFRRARPGVPTLFLFDEPASNLHAKAQMKLLESFPQILTPDSAIIYSTHSQYMIDPLRLEHAYIVQNLAIDFEGETFFDTKDTDIRATKYRTFVGKYPDRGSYFQPVLDKIAFVRSPLEVPDNVIIVEGKGDFFVFSTAIARIKGLPLNVFPSAGATTMDVQITHCLGYGKRFVVLCDDDKAGREAKASYRSKYYIDASKVVTYGDLDPAFSGYSLESLITDEMRSIIETHFATAEFRKEMVVRYFQEAAVNEALPLCASFVDAILPVLRKLQERVET